MISPSESTYWTPERRQEAREIALAYMEKTKASRQARQAERIRQNIPERLCEEFFKSDGFTVTKRGWPDFIVRKGNRVLAVEVKPSIHGPLKTSQSAVMDWFITLGVECYQWAPDGAKRLSTSTAKPKPKPKPRARRPYPHPTPAPQKQILLPAKWR